MHIYLIAGYLFTAILGTLSHFFYNWSGKYPLIALFSPINESTWEHMKLIFFPVLFYLLVTCCFIIYFIHSKEQQQQFCSSLLLGNLLGTLSIPILFYTYSGILGKHFLFVDILIFLIGLLIVFFTAWKLYDSAKIFQWRHWIKSITLLFLIFFFIFTFYPPQIGLFRQP